MNKPIKKYTYGNIEVAIWQNEGPKGSFLTATLTRQYKDRNGDWKTTHSMRISDLPNARIALGKAYEEAKYKQEADTNEDEGNPFLDYM